MPMSQLRLATYLNDHLAGYRAAIELIKHLESVNAGTKLEPTFAQWRREITEDQAELQRLMDRLQTPISRTRQATAWIAQKMSQIRLQLDDPAGGELHLLQAVEALAVGVDSKIALWNALEAAADCVPGITLQTIRRVKQHAIELRQRVEDVRITLACAALKSNAASISLSVPSGGFGS